VNVDNEEREAREAARAFGFPADGTMHSLCRYSPVYQIYDGRQYYVIKRTGFPRSSGRAIAVWLRTLREQGIDVVAPDERFSRNPRRIRDEDPYEWVIYPFVDGLPYEAGLSQIAAAGRLLGEIHLCGAELGRDMLELAALPVPDLAKAKKYRPVAKRYLQQWAPASVSRFDENIRLAISANERRISNDGQDLPRTACSWDYRASNLVFVNPDKPILVDPDHGGRIPRLHDLACSVILFHSACPTAPHRLWTVDEWEAFRSAYKSRIGVREIEIAEWQRALYGAWLDEGLWLLANFPEGWEDPAERTFLIDLATAKLSQFSLA